MRFKSNWKMAMDRGDEHAREREDQHGVAHRQLAEHLRLVEHREVEAKQHVDRHLGVAARKANTPTARRRRRWAAAGGKRK